MDELSANERELLAIIWRYGPIARSDVSRHTHLTQQSVHRLLDGLNDKHLLCFGEAAIRGRGKPSLTVDIDGRAHATIGIAINAEAVRFCLADLKGRPLEQGVLAADPNDPVGVAGELDVLLQGWRSETLAGRELIGTGIAMQGYRTGPNDLFHPMSRLTAWRGIPVETLFRERFRLPAFVENNASSSAIAEHFLGGGGGHDCFAYLSFNYGFGAGLMWNRKVFLGGHGNAGEMGPLFTEDQKKVRPALGNLIEILNGHGLEIRSPGQLAREFRADWPGLEQWLDMVRPQMQLTVRALKAIADPSAVFFGGDAPTALRLMLIEIAQSGFGSERSPHPLLLPSEIEGDAAHLGAAFLPLHNRIY
jgi:predicted NBD/HSP70 family sugar kinase